VLTGNFPDMAEKPAKELGTCPICLGKGRVPMRTRAMGNRQRTKVCAQCRGTGKATRGYLTK